MKSHFGLKWGTSEMKKLCAVHSLYKRGCWGKQEVIWLGTVFFLWLYCSFDWEHCFWFVTFFYNLTMNIFLKKGNNITELVMWYCDTLFDILVLRYCGLNGAGVSLKRQHIMVSALLNLHHSQSQAENANRISRNTLIIQNTQHTIFVKLNKTFLHISQSAAAYIRNVKEIHRK